jgi:hypothetical protein
LSLNKSIHSLAENEFYLKVQKFANICGTEYFGSLKTSSERREPWSHDLLNAMLLANTSHAWAIFVETNKNKPSLKFRLQPKQLGSLPIRANHSGLY